MTGPPGPASDSSPGRSGRPSRKATICPSPPIQIADYERLNRSAALRSKPLRLSIRGASSQGGLLCGRGLRDACCRIVIRGTRLVAAGSGSWRERCSAAAAGVRRLAHRPGARRLHSTASLGLVRGDAADRARPGGVEATALRAGIAGHGQSAAGICRNQHPRALYRATDPGGSPRPACPARQSGP